MKQQHVNIARQVKWILKGYSYNRLFQSSVELQECAKAPPMQDLICLVLSVASITSILISASSMQRFYRMKHWA